MKNNLIYQYYIKRNGIELPEYVKLSWKSVSKYAKKIGVKYKHSTKSFFKIDHYSNYHLNKTIYYFEILRLIYDKYFDQYDDILFLDSDILVTKKSENIFEKYNNVKHIAGWNERNIVNSLNSPTYSDKKSEEFKLIREVFFEFKIPIIKPKTRGSFIRIINSGVLLFTKEARILAREKFDSWKIWANQNQPFWFIADQIYLNAMFNKYNFDITEIGDEWNMMYSWFNPTEYPLTYFIHFCNYTKIFLIKQNYNSFIEGLI